jgi:2-oxoglutarate dehydrogenase E1 component
MPDPALPHEANLAFVEALYADYLRDPDSVDPAWGHYFESWGGNGHALQRGPRFRRRSLFNPAGDGDGGDGQASARQDRVDQLVRAYRVRGHLIARTDPLGRQMQTHEALKIRHYGFTRDDLRRYFSSRTIAGNERRQLRDILLLLRDTYCRSIGVQFMHIDELRVRHWLQDRMEGSTNRIKLPRDEQLRIFTRLTDAVIFEEFIQKKYLGAKRFSLEGGESLIPLLDLAIERAGDQGIEEIVIGMAHRGRINVLANILDKSPREIFREFADVDAQLHLGSGDVKYHLGYHSDWTTRGGKTIHLALCFNPSHLEFVNPVVLGRLRAKQDRFEDYQRRTAMAILIHGDAAFAGEGVVQETLNLSELKDYRTGGTLHVIVNNQIGFTTPPEQGCSGLYASSLAKMLQVPIFHVNGESPEAVAQAIRLSMDFRDEFQRDVVINMYCYRRYGHNEGDEPAFTQPLMYKKIKARKSVRDGYLEHLLALGEVTQEEADQIAADRRTALEKQLAGLEEEGPSVPHRPSVLGRIWRDYKGGLDSRVPEVDTGVSTEQLTDLMRRATTIPDDFTPHPKLKRLVGQRRAMVDGDRPLDWASAELLAFASLATEGTRIRMSGQDSERGTFSQRHAVWHDHESGRPYPVLQNLTADQAPVDIYNSPLSEAGVLGFEYGYSIAYPDGLVLWEAQFGDFVNAAQVIIDQFIASAEDKWQSLSGIVLLLPHGFEGQGPEHSSARLERFLTLCAEDNIQVVYPTTPAQYFHVLRRQVHRRWRKPLVVMTPKSLLRDSRATSPLDELAAGRFRRVLPDPQNPDPQQVRRVLLCAGKVFYDLDAHRQEHDRHDVAIVRCEQLYPLADSDLESVLGVYPDSAEMVWVQEEPANMGAWSHYRVRFGDRLLGRWTFRGVSRPPSASPATGSPGSHKLEQQQLIDEAFAA